MHANPLGHDDDEHWNEEHWEDDDWWHDGNNELASHLFDNDLFVFHGYAWITHRDGHGDHWGEDDDWWWSGGPGGWWHDDDGWWHADHHTWTIPTDEQIREQQHVCAENIGNDDLDFPSWWWNYHDRWHHSTCTRTPIVLPSELGAAPGPIFKSISGDLVIEATSAAGAIVDYRPAWAISLVGPDTITYSRPRAPSSRSGRRSSRSAPERRGRRLHGDVQGHRARHDRCR